MKEFFDFLFSSYVGGIISVLVGLYMIRYTIKNPDRGEDKWMGADVSGWGAGIGFILIGIAILIAKLVGKL